MLLKIFLFFVGLYLFLQIFMRWILPWIIKRHIKRMDNFINEKYGNNKTTSAKSATRKAKKRQYNNANAEN